MDPQYTKMAPDRAQALRVKLMSFPPLGKIKDEPGTYIPKADEECTPIVTQEQLDALATIAQMTEETTEVVAISALVVDQG